MKSACRPVSPFAAQGDGRVRRAGHGSGAGVRTRGEWSSASSAGVSRRSAAGSLARNSLGYSGTAGGVSSCAAASGLSDGETTQAMSSRISATQRTGRADGACGPRGADLGGQSLPPLAAASPDGDVLFDGTLPAKGDRICGTVTCRGGRPFLAVAQERPMTCQPQPQAERAPAR